MDLMDISYENKMNLAFDKPLEYKKIYLYPATLYYYSIFNNAEDFLDISRLDEKDVNLLHLSYLDYMYQKSVKDKNFENKWNMLLFILKIVLKDQMFEIIKENNHIFLKIYQKTNEFEKMNEKYEEINKYILEEYGKSNNITYEMQLKIEELDSMKKKMFSFVLINSEEFDEIRNLIMIQNDIKPEHYSYKIEKMLYEAQKKMTDINKNDINFEDLLTAMSYVLHIKQEDMYDMTIRRFNRYSKILFSKDDYYLYKNLELSGKIKPKSDLSYWIGHYEPKGKFDNVLIKNSSLLSSLGQDNKI